VPTADSGTLFDHLVPRWRAAWAGGETETLGGLQVDNQFELDGGLNGQVRRLLALEDAVDVTGCPAKMVDPVRSVGQQAFMFSKDAERTDGREVSRSRRASASSTAWM
jgi:hypothetical protein